MTTIKHIIIIALLVFVDSVFAQIPPQPKPARLVNDFANILTEQQRNQIEESLLELDRSSSTQIVVVTVDDLGGMAASQFATELGHQWGIGQADKDNGIVFLVKPPTSDYKGAVYLSVGYGLEGVLPDIVAHQIISQEILPRFKNGEIHAGILSGAEIVKEIVSNEYTAEEYSNKLNKKNNNNIVVLITFLFIFAISFTKKSRRGVTMDNQGGHNLGGGFVPPFIFFGGRGSGFGGRGNDPFSGFGGFGGGDFGGGGAGGEW